MEDPDKKIDANFFQLVLSLQMAAMQQMGKIASPLTGKVERNLTQAQASIDMLTMLSKKTENNLTEDEKSLLDRILFELRMNFIDESKKPDTKPEEDKKESEEKGEKETSASVDKPEKEKENKTAEE